ncbi:MAG: O-antigen ligase family protein [Alphaproteobacteria bacterium]|nr:O-antigen ligase family protein [Alphaproteobacteria bacterium]
MIAVWCALIARIYREAYDVSAIVEIGSFTLTFIDIAVVVSFPAALRTVRFANLQFYSRIFVLSLIGIIFLSLLRGIFDNGLLDATTAFRGEAFFYSLLFIFALTPLTSTLSDRILKALTVAGWVLVGLIMVRFAIGMDFLRTTGIYEKNRALYAPGALLLGQIAIIQIGLALSRHSPRQKPQSHLITGVFFLLMIVVLEQRTALIATLAGLAVFLLCQKSANRTIYQLFLPIAVLAAMSLIAFAILDMGWQHFLAAMPESVQSMFGDDTTFTFRTMIWRSMLEQYRNYSSVKQAFGVSFGHSFAWDLGYLGPKFEHSVHNHYLAMLLNTGFVGLGLGIALWLSAIFNNSHLNQATPQRLSLPPAIFMALIVSQIIYSVSYSLTGEQGLVLGLALAFQRPEYHDERPPES